MQDQKFLYDASVTKDMEKIGRPSDIPEQKRLQFLAKYLNRLPFFRRVGETNLNEKYIHKLSIVEKKCGDLITIPPKGAVMVVING